MGVSTGAVATGTIMAVIGVAIMIFGVGLFASGPLFGAEQSSSNGILGIGGGQSSSAFVNILPVLGLVLVVIGAVVLLAGLKGALRSFEKGRERDEGTKHTSITKRG